jgi:methylase of polypeptide subunit release factors
LIPQARQLLASEGVLIVEVGAGQSDQVADLMATSEMRVTEIRRDLAGQERCIVATPE